MGQEAVYVEVGSRTADDVVDYPDIDLIYRRGEGMFSNKRGESY